MTTRSFAWFASSRSRELSSGAIYPAGLTAKFRNAIRIRSRGNDAIRLSLRQTANSFRLIHEEAIFVRPGTLEGAMNSDESMMAMGIPCIVP